jgi:hypothetical protein
MAQQSGVGAFIKLLATVVGVTAALLTLSDRLPTKIETFRSTVYTVAKGDHITVTWRVKGYGAQVFLDGEPVGTEDARDFAVDQDRAFQLAARGWWGYEKRVIAINLAPGVEKERSTPTSQATDSAQQTSPQSNSLPPPSAAAEVTTTAPNGTSPSTLPDSHAEVGTTSDPLRQLSDPQQSNAQANAIPGSGQSSKQIDAIPNPGYLTIHTQVPGTVIRIGDEEFYGQWTDYPYAPGTYTITASRHGIRTCSKIVTVEAREHVVVDFVPQDPTCNGGDSRNDLADAPPVLPNAGGPSTPTVSLPLPPKIMASAYFRSRNLAGFQATANDTLRQGGAVVIDLMHEHLGLSGESMHPVTLTLTPTTLSYDPGSFPCKYLPLSVPLEKIETLEVTSKAVEGKIIGIVVRHLTQGTYLLHVELRDPKSGDKLKLFLATPDSQIIRQNNMETLASPGDSSQVLSAVASVIRSSGNITARK